jgi:glycosyltransferase involved in cell wall biosynthesis
MLQVVSGDTARRKLDREKWHNPLVSIIVTHHNYSAHLEDALLSIIDQTHTNWECVVVDDCSEGGHRAAAEAIVSGIGDNRIKLIALDENKGQVPAFFSGLDATTGEFVCPLDPDDRYAVSFIAEALAAHMNHTTYCPLVSTDQRILKNETVISGCNTRQKLQFMGTVRRGFEIPLQDRDDLHGRLLYYPPEVTGWHWTTTSALMLRRSALDLLRPRKALGYKGSLDAYVGQGAHMLGGSLFLTRPLIYRGLHGDNAYLTPRIFAFTQPMQRENAIEPTKSRCLLDAVEAIHANGGGKHLVEPEKRTMFTRLRKSLRKRWRGGTTA